MKKIVALFTLFLAVCGLPTLATAEEGENSGGKILIAYYSYSGNTQKVAEAIQEKIGGDLFRIETVKDYPDDFQELLQQAKLELANMYHPKLKAKVNNMKDYDVVFIGSPNWWGNIAAPVSSFMAENDLEGKKVVPFITHGKGGVQNTIKGMKKQCEKCNFVEEGWVGFGSRIWGISGWLNAIGFKN
jgi:flavodoxin